MSPMSFVSHTPITRSTAVGLLLSLIVFAGPSLWSAQAEAAETAASTEIKPIGFAGIVAKVKPAVIAVTVRIESGALPTSSEGEQASPQSQDSQPNQNPFGMPEQRQAPSARQVEMALGSGFFISSDGYAVTNNHVVQHGVSFKIATDDGKIYTARVIGADPKTDLALLKVDGRNDFPYVEFANQEPAIGDWVIAVGNPYGLGGTVTAGIVSARGRHIDTDTYDDFIQIDAPINRGNSGGPSFDVDGKVVGVNTAIFSPSGGSVGIGFAIPSTTVKAVIEQLKQKGVVVRGSLGVEIQPVTPELANALGLKKVEGAIIDETVPESAAAKAGLAPGDVVLTINDEPIKNANDLAAKIGGMAPGAAIKIGVSRNGDEKTFSATLGEQPVTPFKTATAPPQQQNLKLGLGLAPAAAAGAGPKGVIITEVDPNGQGAEQGLTAGDIILEIAGKPVDTVDEAHNAINQARESGKQDLLMRIKTSSGRTAFVAVPIAPPHESIWSKIRRLL